MSGLISILWVSSDECSNLHDLAESRTTINSIVDDSSLVFAHFRV